MGWHQSKPSFKSASALWEHIWFPWSPKLSQICSVRKLFSEIQWGDGGDQRSVKGVTILTCVAIHPMAGHFG